jgi:hypothetical protein
MMHLFPRWTSGALVANVASNITRIDALARGVAVTKVCAFSSMAPIAAGREDGAQKTASDRDLNPTLSLT